MKIDYNIDTKIRWKVITEQIDKWNSSDKRTLILAAKDYQSGEGLMNTVYMGGMATAALCREIGRQYGRDTRSWHESLEACSKEALDKAIQVCMHTIEYMWANPVGKCPCGGQIVSKEG